LHTHIDSAGAISPFFSNLDNITKLVIFIFSPF
jgi:hypothetical protein